MNEPARPARTEPRETRGGMSLVDSGTMAEFDRRWKTVQGEFVEDPRGAVGQARKLLAELLDHVSRNLRQERTDGDGKGTGETDTEAMRLELRRYRDLMHRMLGQESNTGPSATSTTTQGPVPRPQGAPRTAD